MRDCWILVAVDDEKWWCVFSDVGDVSGSWGDLNLKLAIGIGLRYRTPAGPISFDLAKAQEQDKIRFHFALGVTF